MLLYSFEFEQPGPLSVVENIKSQEYQESVKL